MIKPRANGDLTYRAQAAGGLIDRLNACVSQTSIFSGILQRSSKRARRGRKGKTGGNGENEGKLMMTDRGLMIWVCGHVAADGSGLLTLDARLAAKYLSRRHVFGRILGVILG
jgi:hypothetical protein